MKLSNWVVVCTVLFVTVACSSILATAKDRVFYDRDGNALIAGGGEKGTASAAPSATLREVVPTGVASATGEIYIPLHAAKQVPFGDSYVRTEFWTGAWTWSDSGEQRVEADGESNTGWLGTVPQYYSSKIRLDESWKFSGLLVSVSYPPGLGFSVSGSTVAWSGECQGDYWELTHFYGGIQSESWFFISSLRQTSSGSHLFSAGGAAWVSASATQGKSTLLPVFPL